MKEERQIKLADVVVVGITSIILSRIIFDILEIPEKSYFIITFFIFIILLMMETGSYLKYSLE